MAFFLRGDLTVRFALKVFTVLVIAGGVFVRETGRRLAPRLAEELRAISERCAALPDYDKRSAEEIIGGHYCDFA